MSLFAQHAPRAPRPPRRRRVGRVLAGTGAVLALALGLMPSPYVIEQPGPVFDTLGTSDHEGAERPLISIPDRPTYPTDGRLDMLTVSVVGNPEQRPDWFSVVSAWLDPSRSVVPLEAVFPANQTADEREAQNQVQMTDSQQDAVAAALMELGVDVPRTLDVQSVLAGSAADGALRVGDAIRTVDGATVVDLADLQARVAAAGTSTPLSFGITRDGQESTVQVTPAERDGRPVIGVVTSTAYEFPFEVDIQLDDVGGPSAGMMFALGIMDKLEEGSLTGGKAIAGTGTIDASGTVGPIGGIRQKLFGAERAGAEYFLAPADNCGEVRGHVPDGLRVFAVSTLDDSLRALSAISSGGDLGALPTC
jgi:PDZ domain-containing protein